MNSIILPFQQLEVRKRASLPEGSLSAERTASSEEGALDKVSQFAAARRASDFNCLERGLVSALS